MRSQAASRRLQFSLFFSTSSITYARQKRKALHVRIRSGESLGSFHEPDCEVIWMGFYIASTNYPWFSFSNLKIWKVLQIAWNKWFISNAVNLSILPSKEDFQIRTNQPVDVWCKPLDPCSCLQQFISSLIWLDIPAAMAPRNMRGLYSGKQVLVNYYIPRFLAHDL